MTDIRKPPILQTRFNLQNRTALITGASGGLGEATAIALAGAGADVVLLARRESELIRVAELVQNIGRPADVIVCDVTNTHKMRAAIGSLKRLDILVNNAGTNIPEPFLEVSEEHLDSQLALNVRAAFFVAQAGVQKMLESPDRRERGGSIINITSQMGRVGGPRRTVYCMGKHAIEGLTKAMALELAPSNIRVNAVAPTFIETPLTSPFFENAEFRDSVVSKIPLGRIGLPGDITGAIIFLASSESSLVTGTSLAIDGGWTAQ